MYVDGSGHGPIWWNPSTWDWNQVLKGIGLVIIGIGAITIGIATLPFGGWISIVAAITIISGGGTAIFGLADTYEGMSGYNGLREGVFMGNKNVYNITRNIFMYSAIVGSIICGVYDLTNITASTRSLPSTSTANSGVWNINDYTLGYYDSFGNLSYSIAFTNHNTPWIHSIPHWHLEIPHSNPINSILEFLWTLFGGGN